MLQEENAAVRTELTQAMADNSALSKALQLKDSALEKAKQEYKSQVSRADSQFTAETMIESLTEQNLALEEKNQQMAEVQFYILLSLFPNYLDVSCCNYKSLS